MTDSGDDRRSRWNRRYAQAGAPAAPAEVLTDYAHLLPASGLALDLACGRGRNALFLAEAGFQVEAWDLSDVAIRELAAVTQQRRLAIHAEQRDVVAVPPAPASMDVIVVSHFLERTLCPALMRALKPGGLLFYQTFVREAVGSAGPSNPTYRLARNELLRLFSSLDVVVYREEGRLGDTRRGLRDVAQLVAQAPEDG